jgi:hypothetical protein
MSRLSSSRQYLDSITVHTPAEHRISSNAVGYDALNSLSPSATRSSVGDFLVLLGYRRLGTLTLGEDRWTQYWHYNEEDYVSHDGLSAAIEGAPGELTVHTRTSIHRSVYDARFHNHTIRQLQSRFGGHFRSDYGRNRFFPVQGENRIKADSGCFIATRRFRNRLAPLEIYLARRNFKNDDPRMGEWSSEILSNHLLVPFVVSALEAWFRDVYEALLRYTPRRGDILRGIRMDASELIDDLGVSLPLERACARRMPFQNIAKAVASFRGLDPKLDLHAALVRPYRRRKVSLFARVNRFLERRHATIHGLQIDSSYTTADFRRDLDDVHASVLRMYDAIAAHYRWEGVERTTFGSGPPR